MNRILANIFLLAIICGALLLLLVNLGNQYLWQDEAETALVSKTILTYGLPHGYDGKNSFSQLIGKDFTKNYIWARHTWLPFYVLAGVYKVFGISTFTSRLPFAILGLASIVMTYFFTKAFLKNQRQALIAAMMLTICVSFLLLARQCRYYSVAIFFSMLSLYAYLMLLEKKKYAGILLFALATLLFHSQHIYLFILAGSMLLHTIIFHRDRLKALSLVITALIIVNGPYVLWLMKINPSFTKIIPASTGFNWLLSDITQFVFPVWLIIAFIVLVVIRKFITHEFCQNWEVLADKSFLLLSYIILNFIMILIISPYPFFRYLGPSIPLLIILMAMIIDTAWRMNKLIGTALVVLLIWTSPLRHYIYEITHDFDGPAEGICKYINEHGTENDLAVITYGDMPLKFYTKLRILGGLTGEDLAPAKDARWIIIRKYEGCLMDTTIKNYLSENVDFNNYRRITLDYPDTLFENREYLREHFFVTQKNEDRVVMYERIK